MTWPGPPFGEGYSAWVAQQNELKRAQAESAAKRARAEQQKIEERQRRIDAQLSPQMANGFLPNGHVEATKGSFAERAAAAALDDSPERRKELREQRKAEMGASADKLVAAKKRAAELAQAQPKLPATRGQFSPNPAADMTFGDRPGRDKIAGWSPDPKPTSNEFDVEVN
jgi:hypothetical protein